jgi:hypothetical protein
MIVGWAGARRREKGEMKNEAGFAAMAGRSEGCRSSARIGWQVRRCVQAAAQAAGGPVQRASRRWASANSVRYGQAEVIATLIRRTETVTRAPSVRSFQRIVPHVASWHWVWRTPMRRNASSSTEANEANHIGRVEVEDDLLWRSLVRFEEDVDEEVGERGGIVTDLVLTVIRA